MKPIQKVVIAGAGLMGHSLAVLHAMGAREVWLTDIDIEKLDDAFSLMSDAITLLYEHGFCEEDPISVCKRIHKSTDIFYALENADLLVEAISEDKDIKKSFFANLVSPPQGKKAIGATTFVASNTSSLNIFSLAPQKLLPRLYVAHHFLPAHILPLVEILPSQSAEETDTEKLLSYYRSLGATPIRLKKYQDGFCINRIQLAIHKEMFAQINDGIIDYVDLDLAVKASLGIRLPILGIFKRLDFANLLLVRNNMVRLDSNAVPPQILDDLITQGHLGISSGRGFYDYGLRKPAEIYRERDNKMLRLRRILESMQA